MNTQSHGSQVFSEDDRHKDKHKFQRKCSMRAVRISLDASLNMASLQRLFCSTCVRTTEDASAGCRKCLKFGLQASRRTLLMELASSVLVVAGFTPDEKLFLTTIATAAKLRETITAERKGSPWNPTDI